MVEFMVVILNMSADSGAKSGIFLDALEFNNILYSVVILSAPSGRVLKQKAST
jgi:hypothetical protein